MTEQLAGRRILLVEDDYFQAREVKQLLERAGAMIVGPTGRANQVSVLLEQQRPDAALVDINLGEGASFDAAHLLIREGVPFAFLTGYDQETIPPDLAVVPRLEKPANAEQVIELVLKLI